MPLRGARCTGAGAFVTSGGGPHRLAHEAPVDGSEDPTEFDGRVGPQRAWGATPPDPCGSVSACSGAVAGRSGALKSGKLGCGPHHKISCLGTQIRHATVGFPHLWGLALRQAPGESTRPSEFVGFGLPSTSARCRTVRRTCSSPGLRCYGVWRRWCLRLGQTSRGSTASSLQARNCGHFWSPKWEGGLGRRVPQGAARPLRPPGALLGRPLSAALLGPCAPALHSPSILPIFYVFFHSMALAALVGFLVYLQAYVFTGMIPG